MNLALFDLDGTLLAIDSDHAFGEFMVRLGWADGEAFRRANDEFYAQYQAEQLDVAQYVRFATSAWRERPASALAEAQRRFIDEVIRPSLHDNARALLRRHEQAGDRIAIVTATNEVVTRPIATLLGVDTLIATELQRDASGRVSGEVLGVPSFREGKVARVQAWLASQGLGLDDFERSHFYSDSTNDLALLEQVSDPVATNPSPALQRIAQQRGWPILRLFE
jgi:HAD superfamily hydrolase (TIGR01490 family)